MATPESVELTGTFRSAVTGDPLTNYRATVECSAKFLRHVDTAEVSTGGPQTVVIDDEGELNLSVFAAEQPAAIQPEFFVYKLTVWHPHTGWKAGPVELPVTLANSEAIETTDENGDPVTYYEFDVTRYL